MWPKLRSLKETVVGGARGRGLILVYHRVVELEPDPWSLFVSPPHFAEQLDVLCRFTNPLSLDEYARCLEKGGLPDRATVVTFDDGYADNLYQAAPELQRFRCPATFFITGAPPAPDREYWWDELHHLFTRNGELPEYLEFTSRGRKHCWKLGRSVRYTEEDRRHDARRPVWAAEEGCRSFIYYRVWNILRPLPHSERLVILESLHEWAGGHRECRPDYRPMTPREIAELSANKLFTIGGHTATHALLPAHPSDVQRNEMLQNKWYLQQLSNREIYAISYPYGECTAEMASVAREAGFRIGCSTDSGVVSTNRELLRLPRVPVEDWDGREFKDRLGNWLSQSC